MTLPNPVRTLESHGIEDQTSEDWKSKSCLATGDEHHMETIKTNSEKIPMVEQCTDCSWIDGASLDWWSDNAIKLNESARAQRIAVATETEPFAFAQSSREELTLREVLYQSLGAASACWENLRGAGVFDSTRAKSVGEALEREVNRFMRLEREDAAARLRQALNPHFPIEVVNGIVRTVEEV